MPWHGARLPDPDANGYHQTGKIKEGQLGTNEYNHMRTCTDAYNVHVFMSDSVLQDRVCQLIRH